MSPGEAALIREAADANSQKMSGRVRVQRWPSTGPVVGPQLMMAPLDKVAAWLYESNFMRPWLEQQIKSHLLNGGQFVNKGRDVHENEAAGVPNGEQIAVRVRSEYRLATELEVLNFVDTSAYASSAGRAVSKRSQERGYVLHYHEDLSRIKSYDNLPRQARVVLDILNEAGREEFTEASILCLLDEPKSIERLKTKQNSGLIFGFYRKRLIEENHLEEVGNGDD
jgi:hypothetical protein